MILKWVYYGINWTTIAQQKSYSTKGEYLQRARQVFPHVVYDLLNDFVEWDLLKKFQVFFFWREYF